MTVASRGEGMRRTVHSDTGGWSIANRVEQKRQEQRELGHSEASLFWSGAEQSLVQLGGAWGPSAVSWLPLFLNEVTRPWAVPGSRVALPLSLACGGVGEEGAGGDLGGAREACAGG